MILAVTVDIPAWTAFVTALGVTLGVALQIVTAVLSAIGRRNAAVQVAEVKETAKESVAVAQKTAEIADQKLGEIHELVNGGMTQQKEITKIVTRQLADQTGSTSSIRLADAAEKSYQDQLVKAANASLKKGGA